MHSIKIYFKGNLNITNYICGFYFYGKLSITIYNYFFNCSQKYWNFDLHIKEKALKFNKRYLYKDERCVLSQIMLHSIITNVIYNRRYDK